jgi:hypothetical protein
LLGVDYRDNVTYFQARTDEIHAPLFDTGMEHDLDLHFREDPLENFHSYIQDSRWRLLHDPDYEAIAEEHGYELPELDDEDGNGQAGLNEWRTK